MEDNNPPQNMPVLCVKGCGFFGSASFDGFCSKCHRDASQQQQQNKEDQIEVVEIEGSSTDEEVPLGEAEQKVVEECVKVADALVANVVSSVDACKSPSTAELPNQDDPKLSQPAADTMSNASSLDSTPRPKRNRCHACKKKVGLTGFTCRCGGTFCSNHRYSDTHSCSFDYRESGQTEIRRANPQIQCSKVQKI